MKKVILLLTIACCLVACEGNLPKAMSEVERSGKYVWSYMDQKSSEVEAALEEAGWKQNYSGKTYSGSPVRLYIYNRPGDLSWGPCHFRKYATSDQKTNRESLRKLLESGKVYGELYMIYSYNKVLEMGVYWLTANINNNAIDGYEAFSNGLYKAYKADCGNDAQWEGKIDSNVFTNHQRFIDQLKEFYQPKIKEEAYYNSSSKKCVYDMESMYNYQLNNTFEFEFRAEKYTK